MQEEEEGKETGLSAQRNAIERCNGMARKLLLDVLNFLLLGSIGLFLALCDVAPPPTLLLSRALLLALKDATCTPAHPRRACSLKYPTSVRLMEGLIQE